MSFSFRQNIKRNLLNVRGWRTKERYVIFESDDWGSVRMASKEAFNRLLQQGVPVDKSVYDSNDALESNEDLELLFEVLGSVKDRNGNPAIITANNIVGNPDFEKIRASGYNEYFYEPFTETLKRYPRHNRVPELYRQGIEQKIFLPQFHGREHLNVQNWMRCLQEGDQTYRLAAELNMFSVKKQLNSNSRKQFLDAFGTYSQQQLNDLEKIISEGLDLFSKIWGFRSTTVIAPCYVWHPKAEEYFADNGIRMIQSGPAQLVPVFGKESVKVVRKFTGQKNALGQVYSVRNALFEPTANPAADWVDSCLQEMKISFRWNKPAVISTHRLNYIGYINPQNRSGNLKLLATLLKRILQHWPDAVFLTSSQLADIMLEN